MKILIVCNNSAGLERFRGKLLQSLIEGVHGQKLFTAYAVKV